MSSRHFDLNLVRAFVTVAECGSMTVAAKHLHVTQSGLSHQIKRLEDAIGCFLLDRDARGCRLTAEGTQFIERARQLLALNDVLFEEMAAGDTASTICIGVPHDMAGAHFAPMLKAYAQRYPAVDVRILTGSSVDLMESFAAGSLDLTLSQIPVQKAAGDRLALEPLVWVTGTGSCGIERPLPLCFVTTTCTFRKTVFPLLSEAGIDWRTMFDNASVETTLSTVRSGLAVTPWLRSLIPEGLGEVASDVNLPKLPDFAIELNIKARPSSAALAMATVIREHYALRARQFSCAECVVGISSMATTPESKN
jgi:DNA-binding transcriptional LysR family regulator